MTPPIFKVCNESPEAQALLNSGGVTRLLPFGQADQNTAKPYAVWQIVSGAPENYLAGTPDIDSYTVQIDVYAVSGASARAVAAALRDAIEPHAHIVSWRGESKDESTGNIRFSFDADWFVPR